MMRTFTIGFKIIRSQIAPILTESTSLKSQTNSKSKCQMKSKCLNAKTTSLLFELWALLFGFLRFPRLFYVKLYLLLTADGIQDVDLTIEVRRIDNTLLNYRLCPVPIPAHEFPFQ